MESENQRVKFLDVGHGDSSVIYLNSGHSENENVVIVDIVDSDKLLTELTSHKIKVVDLIIISHSDADHCRGVNDFLEKYMAVGIVKNICFNLDKRQSTKTMKLILKKFIEIYQKQRITLLMGQNDTSVQKRELISNDKSKLFLIYPNVAESTEAYLKNDTNNTSIVCLLENDVCNVLFSGDLEGSGWEKLLERMPELKCEVLKMPHHGAFYDEKSGIGLKQILEILQPRDVIISSGDNKKYKHPDMQTIELLKEKNIKVYCTEFTSLCHCNANEFNRKCYGDIEIAVTDTAYEIRTEKENFSLLNHIACQE